MQKRLALSLADALDMRREIRIHVEEFSSRLRMSANDRVRFGRPRGLDISQPTDAVSALNRADEWARYVVGGRHLFEGALERTR